MRGPRSDTQSDSDKVKQANHKLRAENQKLRKQVQQLQKELKRYIESGVDPFEEEEDEESRYKPPPPKAADKCPRCKEPIIVLDLGPYIIRKCTGCVWRSKKEA